MYTIQFHPSAVKDYNKIPKKIIHKINSLIESLKQNPRPSGYIKLKNRDAYRIRAGDYRIIYEIHEKEVVVIVMRIRHRKEVYKNI